MSYATQEDMVERFGLQEIIQRTDRERSGMVDAAVLDRALIDADARIDGYLSGRYKTPLTTVPRLIVGISCDLARYFLYDDIATDGVKKRFDDAIKLLESISKGNISLGVDYGMNEAQPVHGVKYSAPGRVFNDSSLEGY